MTHSLFRPFMIIAVLSVCVSAAAADRRQIDFQSSSGRGRIPLSAMVMLEPTLPAPALVDEPEYTRGDRNTVYWESGDVIDAAGATGYEVILFEVEAQIENRLLWGFVDVGVDSATFRDLPEGIRILYRLRYYAEGPTGGYAVSHWSEPVHSVQDWSRPVLHAWNIRDMQHASGMAWVVGQAVWIRVVASDSLYGGIMQIAIHEESRFSQDTTFYDIESPAVYMDTLIPYPLRTPANEPIAISLWVVDVAGQVSDAGSIVRHEFFWWTHEEETPGLICYPNPFHPAAGEKSVIKMNQPGIESGRIFDPFGNLIIRLTKPAGTLFFEWDGTNREGRRVARGGYIFVVDGRQDLYCKIAVY